MVGWEGHVSDRLSSVLRSYFADTHTYMCSVDEKDIQ